MAEQSAQMVANFKQQSGQRLIYLQFVATYFIQHTLSHMGKRDHKVKSKQACRAFNGVCSAEYGIDAIHIVWLLLQMQERFFHMLQKLAAFDNKSLECII